MKNYTGILLLFGLLLAGCDDYLSQVPDNRTRLDSKAKIGDLLVTAYPEAGYAMFCEAMSDNVEDNPSASQDLRNADAYFWRDGVSTHQDSPEYYWNACYAAIASANHALRFIENSETPEIYNAEKGEALLARAYAHFMLVNLFAKFYKPATADFYPGIPYVTEPETESLKTYDRHTVGYVYQMIEKDLTQGIPLIDDQSYETGNNATGVVRYHFTKSTAHAFAVRFYLFKQEYNKVITHADLVFSGSIEDKLRPWNADYKSLSAEELAVTYTKSSEGANLLLCETASEWARSFNALRYSTGAIRYQQIFNTPINGNLSLSTFYTSSGVYFINKFKEHFVRGGMNANTGIPYTIVPLFTTEEVLLSRAEAYAYQDSYHKALDDLNIWVAHRVDNYDPDLHNLTFNKIYNFYQNNVNRENILAATLHFRRIEFLHEGLRWFDILRHNIPVTHTTSTGEVVELKPGDPRRILQIPQEAVSIGGLQPNPR